MKNLKTTVLNVFAISTILIGATACGNHNADSKEVAEDHNEAKFDDNKKDDAQFVVDAAEINMKEVKLGQLAQQKGMSAEVKALGKMMEDAHTKALNDLTALAAKKTITIPTSLTEKCTDAYNKLNEKSGKDFDKEYADMMVDGHKKAIEKFEKESNDGTDADIKGWASSMLPGLRTHLDHSMMCQNKVSK